MRGPDAVRRQAKGLLNKLSPENEESILNKLERVEVRDVEELQAFAGMILEKALRDPGYIKVYGAAVERLRAKRAVRTPTEEEDGGRLVPLQLSDFLVVICREQLNEVCDLLRRLGDGEVVAARVDEFEVAQRSKARAVAFARFVAELFQRDLLSARIVGWVAVKLIWSSQADGAEKSTWPTGPTVECACELLSHTGPKLALSPPGLAALKKLHARLAVLCGFVAEANNGDPWLACGNGDSLATSEGRFAGCPRIRCLVRNLLEAYPATASWVW